jgi:hypothetical protein
MPLSLVDRRDGGQASASPGTTGCDPEGRGQYQRARWPWARLGKYLELSRAANAAATAEAQSAGRQSTGRATPASAVAPHQAAEMGTPRRARRSPNRSVQ